MTATVDGKKFDNPAALMSDIARYYRILIDREMQPLGLTRSQWWLLANLYNHDGLNQKELASILDIGKSATGKLLHKLEEKGWVERRPDEGDGRAYNVFLTKRIQPLVERLTDLCMQLVNDTLSEFSEAEVKKFSSLLTRLNTRLVNMTDHCDESANKLRCELKREIDKINRS